MIINEKHLAFMYIIIAKIYKIHIIYKVNELMQRGTNGYHKPSKRRK